MLDDTVIFVEVKTRTSAAFGEPVEAVGPAKQAKLRNLAQEYLISHGLEESNARFDVLGIMLDADGPSYEHLTDAF
jgi:putative endonuclease